jgi:hypothetical protein
MKSYYIIIISAISFLLSISTNSFCYREKVHRTINSNVIEQKLSSGLVGGYFAIQLG